MNSISAAGSPGDQKENGIIVPGFGSKPENFVAVSMSLQAFCEFVMITKAHYEAWLAAWYMTQIAEEEKGSRSEQQVQQKQYGMQNAPQILQQQGIDAGCETSNKVCGVDIDVCTTFSITIWDS